jgi:hypothetical protein
VRMAYGRAKRTHAEFAHRHGLPALPFEPAAPGAPSQGIKGFVSSAVEAVGKAGPRTGDAPGFDAPDRGPRWRAAGRSSGCALAIRLCPRAGSSAPAHAGALTISDLTIGPLEVDSAPGGRAVAGSNPLPD